MITISSKVVQCVSQCRFLVTCLLFMPLASYAAVPMGSEFDSTMTPAAGGMVGIGTVRPQDPLSGIFSNPATLTQTGGNEFLIGLTYGNLDLRADDSPSGAFGGYKGDSDLRDIALPHFAATHRLNSKLVGAIGITAISGLGGDFRDDPAPGGFGAFEGPISDLKVFAGAFSGAYQVNDSVSMGGSVIVGIGIFQGGLFGQTASVNGYGVAGQLGMTFSPKAVPISFGLSYRTELNLAFDSVFQTSATNLRGLSLEQPWQIAAGIATTDSFSKNTILALEYRYKAYDDAEFYQDIWQDQHSINLGAQHTIPFPIFGKLKLRVGYRYASDVAKDFSDLGTSIAGLNSVYSPTLNAAVPVSPVILNFFQVTAANGYWSQALSVGVGAEVLPGVEANVYGAASFDGDQTVGLFRAQEHFFHGGFGLIWKFD